MDRKMNIVPLRELNLTDRFLFDEVMEDSRTQQDVLSIIFGKEVPLLEKNQTEKELRVSPLIRSIRMDVFSMDEEKVIYNTEMQQSRRADLAKRTRYYTYMNIAYKSNNNIVYSCKYHVVWCPKYRRKILTNGIDTRLKELLLAYAANISVDIMEMEIMPDHVHILMEVDPQFGVHKAIKSLKGYTSKVLRSEYPSLKTRMPSLWTNSYFVSTVGGAPLDVIKQYIENQKTSQRQKDKQG